MNATLRSQERAALDAARATYLAQHATKREISPRVAAAVPEKLRSALNTAFYRAFALIYQKGTPLLDRTYDKQGAEERCQENRFAHALLGNRKTFHAFSRASDISNAVSLVISGVEGIGLGIIGCGIPDIPLLTAVILRNLYELSAHYGYDHTTPGEQLYQLMLIQSAMSYGEDLQACFDRLDAYAASPFTPSQKELDEQIRASATALADAMLFLKFVQGIPVVGVIGGVSDTVFLHRIQRVAKLHYQSRLLLSS